MKGINAILAGFALVGICAGCNTLSDVQNELARGGYVLWYPAESNIEPGQIWQTDGETKLKQDRKPQNLQVDTNDAVFETLTKEIDASASLNAGAGSGILGEIGDLSAALTNAGVQSVSLNFGKCTIQRITLGDLRDANVAGQFPRGYAADLQRVKRGEDGWILIDATVVSSGLQYVFTTTNAASFRANAPAIAKLISAGLNFSFQDARTVVWNIPGDQDLVIGFLPVSGPLLNVTDEEAIKAVGRQLKKMKKQDLLKLMINVGMQLKANPQ